MGWDGLGGESDCPPGPQRGSLGDLCLTDCCGGCACLPAWCGGGRRVPGGKLGANALDDGGVREVSSKLEYFQLLHL